MFTAPDTTVSAQAGAATRRRSWIERAGARRGVPCWRTREAWLTDLRDWAQSRALPTLCTAERVSITATTLLAIAEVMAEHADHATGRHVAITRATIAERLGCHKNTVSNAWAVLRAAGWAIEARRGHGSPTTPSLGCRASVYHLVPRRPTASAPAATQPAELRGIEPLTSPDDINGHPKPVENCDLPPSGGVYFLPPVGSNSPSAHPREKTSAQPSKSRRCRAEPRPLALQQLAAHLANRCHGLRSGHIGAICDAIAAAGIDPAVWSAADIKQALEADMRRTGGTWPDQITNPGGFLASRLRKLGTFAGRTPARAAVMSRPSVPSAPPPPAQPALSSTTNTGTGRVEAFAELAAARRRALHRRTAAAAADTVRRDALIATIRAATPPGRSTTVWR